MSILDASENECLVKIKVPIGDAIQQEDINSYSSLIIATVWAKINRTVKIILNQLLCGKFVYILYYISGIYQDIKNCGFWTHVAEEAESDINFAAMVVDNILLLNI